MCIFKVWSIQSLFSLHLPHSVPEKVILLVFAMFLFVCLFSVEGIFEFQNSEEIIVSSDDLQWTHIKMGDSIVEPTVSDDYTTCPPQKITPSFRGS